jgi:hypothetical protein
MERSHLEEVNEGYFKHMFNSLKYFVKFLQAALACLIHAFLPNTFKSTASVIASDVVYDVEKRKQK